jgi:S1-C subfamily serine protease
MKFLIIKKTVLAILALGMISINVFAADEAKKTGNGNKITSIVKVFCVYSNPNYYQPWQNYQQGSSTGSGCIISGNRILTNAHLVANQAFLMVRKQGDPKKYIARLLATGHECDLALLTVDDSSFFKDMPPIEFGGLPELQDTVQALGYPMGGDNISITEGVVSRIEPVVYSHSGKFLMAIQVDAAINPGNSGGPVVDDNGKMVGVAFQGLSQGENMGYMIPMPIVKHFLKDIKDGKFDGFPDYNFKSMKMENPDLRNWAKMKEDQTGIMITDIPPMKKNGVLKVNDVILEIDGVPIANDATVPFRKDEVIYFGNLIWEKYIGEVCKFKILRSGKEMDIDYKLSKVEKLVPDRVFDEFPTYYIIGGLLFVPLCQNYLDSWGNWWGKAPRQLTNFATYGEITEKRNEIVVLSEVLADNVNIGYQNIKYVAVLKVNRVEVKNLKHLIELIEKTEGDFVEIKLQNYLDVVLDLKKLKEANSRILKRYRIPSDRSLNLVEKK